MRTVLLLFFSNCFMPCARYEHPKYVHTWPLWKVIAVSWAIALFEILPGGAGESPRLWRVLRLPAEGYSRGSHAPRLHGLRNHILERKVASNYLVAFAFLRSGAVLRFFVQALRTGGLNRRHAGTAASDCRRAVFPSCRIGGFLRGDD